MPASAAAEVAKIEDDGHRRELVGRIAAGEMTRDEAVEEVRQVASQPRSGTSKGKGRGSAKPQDHRARHPDGRRSTGDRRVQEGTRHPGHPDGIREATVKAEAELAEDQAAA